MRPIVLTGAAPKESPEFDLNNVSYASDFARRLSAKSRKCRPAEFPKSGKPTEPPTSSPRPAPKVATRKLQCSIRRNDDPKEHDFDLHFGPIPTDMRQSEFDLIMRTIAAVVQKKNPQLSQIKNLPLTDDAPEMPGNNETLAVKVRVLQNQVESLQWQLERKSTTTKMMRSVLNETQGFLKRYNLHMNNCREEDAAMARNEKMTRSRSLHQMHEEAKNTNQPMEANKRDGEITFLDLTWQRETKKAKSNRNTAEDKLNEEAFRLSRHIHNILNSTEELPHNLPFAPCNGSTFTFGENEFSSLNIPPRVSDMFFRGHREQRSLCQDFGDDASRRFSLIALSRKNSRDSASPAEGDFKQPFPRATQSRVSESSSQSSNIASTPSGSPKPTADKETPPSCLRTKRTQNGSCPTEDESGFSSINSMYDTTGVASKSQPTPKPNCNNGANKNVSGFSFTNSMHDNTGVASKSQPTPKPNCNNGATAFSSINSIRENIGVASKSQPTPKPNCNNGANKNVSGFSFTKSIRESTGVVSSKSQPTPKPNCNNGANRSVSSATPQQLAELFSKIGITSTPAKSRLSMPPSMRILNGGNIKWV